MPSFHGGVKIALWVSNNLRQPHQGSPGTLTGTAVIACWVAVACQLVALLTAILSFLTTCYLSVPMPIVTLGLNAITALADLCLLGAGIVGAFAEAVKGALRILRMFQGL